MHVKKVGLLIVLVICLLGCQSQKKAEPIEISKNYKVAEKLDFEIIKSEVVKEIAPSNKNKTFNHLVPKSHDNIFVDLVMKMTNLSEKEITLKEAVSGHYKINKQTYDVMTAIETINYNQMSQTDTLKTNEGRYVHLYCELPEEQIKDEATVELKILNQDEFVYTFETTQKIENNNAKSLGDVITLKNSQMTLNHISQSNKVEPSNKGFFYSYYPTENENETFVILQIDLKNTTDSTIDPKDYLYCEYQIQNKKYESMIVLESENHKSLSKTGKIESLQTRTLYLAMAVKNEDLKQEGKIHLFVEGNNFEIDNYSE
ncbi:MAG: hypothetical protein ACLUVC_15095 [Longibaculum sp.]